MGHHNIHNHREAARREKRWAKDAKRGHRPDIMQVVQIHRPSTDIVIYGNSAWSEVLERELNALPRFNEHFSVHRVGNSEEYLALMDRMPSMRVGTLLVEGFYWQREWKCREFFELLGVDLKDRTCLVHRDGVIVQPLDSIRPYIDAVLPRQPVNTIYQYMLRKAAGLNGDGK